MAGGGALAPSLASDLADATGRVTLSRPDPSLTDSSAIGAAIGAAIVAAAGVTGQVGLAVGPYLERAGIAPDRRRSAWWELQAERHESAVAGQKFSR